MTSKIVLRTPIMVRVRFLAVLALMATTIGGAFAQAVDPLPSWNEGNAKQAILVSWPQ